MAQAGTVSTHAAARANATAKTDRSFLWRRLHSLTGVVPVGGYMVYHLYENMAALKSPHAYDVMVNEVNTMLPRAYFHGLELGMIMIPLLFHALYGLYIAQTGHANSTRYA